jgi:hypothetical protein
MLVSKIKEEAAHWCLAGVKALCNIMSREYALSYFNSWLFLELVCNTSKTSLFNENGKSFALFQKKIAMEIL